MPALAAGLPADNYPAGRLRRRGPADSVSRTPYCAAANANLYPPPGHPGQFPVARACPGGRSAALARRNAAAVFIPGPPAAAAGAGQPAAIGRRCPGTDSGAVPPANANAYAYAGRHGRAAARPPDLNPADRSAGGNAAAGAHAAANLDARPNAPAYACVAADAHALAQRDDYRVHFL